MNNNEFVVMCNGGMPSLVNKNSVTHWEMTSMGYETLHSGSKRECQAYWEEVVAQMVEIDYFSA